MTWTEHYVFTNKMVPSSPLKALLVGLIQFFIATSALPTASVCRLPACTCDEMAFPDDVRNSTSQFGYSVTCFVKSFTLWDETISRLTPDITSLKAVCTDPDAQSRLTFGYFRQVPGLVYLGLENCNFVTAASDAFKDASNLTSLEIHNCRFTKLPKNLFDEKPPLTRLTLSSCGLDSLPRLCHLTGLEKLNVSGQAISSMDKCVTECGSNGSNVVFHSLVSLDISNNAFIQLPTELTKRAPNLRELHISNNKLQTLRLQNVIQLQVLDALGQALQSVDFVSAAFLPHLRVLKLEGDSQVHFPVESLKGLSNLTHLHLQNMGVDDGVWDVLPSLSSLQRLLLPHNRLETVKLTGSVPLTHLNLSTNAIKGVDSATFSAQRGLVEVDLSSNNVTKIMSGVFVDMPALQTLLLKHNQIRILLQSGFRDLPSLQLLSLAYNALGSLPVHFLKSLPALKFLGVDNNSLAYLPSMAHCPQLALFSANYNKIKSLSFWNLAGLKNLEYLHLRGNQLTEIESAKFLTAAPSLAVLDLSENDILVIQPFLDHPSLRLVQLENNRIQDVSLVFRHLAQLTAVFLDNNHLTRLTVNMFPPSLSYLSVSRNYLTYIEPSLFVAMPRLIAVHLAANYALDRLPLAWVKISPLLVPKPTFMVGPNVFTCDCEMGYLKAWTLQQTLSPATSTTANRTAPLLLAHLPRFSQLSLLECFTHFSNGDVVKFYDVPEEDFVCPYDQPLCADNCPCCTPHYDLDPNCTCVLTCPESCTCFHGGSEYTSSFARVLCNSRNLTEFPDLIPALATHVHLDGNTLTVLNNTKPRLLTQVRFLYLNHSGLDTLQDGCFQGLDSLQLLDLSHNRLTDIGESTFGKMAALTALNLSHNHIEHIHPKAFSQLQALQRLDLHHNRLKEVATFQHFMPEVALTLSNNPWTCDCAFADGFLKFLIRQRDQILDFSSVRCLWYNDNGDKNNSSHEVDYSSKRKLLEMPKKIQNDTESNTTQKDPNQPTHIDLSGLPLPSLLMSEYQYNVLCRNVNHHLYPQHQQVYDSRPHQGTTVAIACVVVVAVVVVVVGLLVVRHRRELQALLYSKLGVRLWDDTARMDREEEEKAKKGQAALQAAGAAPHAHIRPKKYDAFISFSHHDLDFVVNTLVPRLEQQGPRYYKLCVHYRDFPVGDSIADSIVDSVETSKRVILLLSNHFVDSEWCLFEFRTAHQHVLREGGRRLIIVLLDQVQEERLDPDLKVRGRVLQVG